jgi:hypothetical protein
MHDTEINVWNLSNDAITMIIVSSIQQSTCTTQYNIHNTLLFITHKI